MRLFELGNDFKIELNKVWIMMIPEFAAVIKRDRGSEGDYRGDLKLRARREFTFIYFDLDFTSPIREWEEFDRREEAMKYAGLKESDLDTILMAAHKKYNQLLEHTARSLKTLRAVEHSLEELDNYFQDLDFTAVDKKGELLHTPSSYLTNLKNLGPAYDAVDKFRRRVDEELKGGATIRGTASLGRKEGSRSNEWNEGHVNDTASPDFTGLKSSFGDNIKEEDLNEDD